MAHFAQLNDDNTVVQVIVVHNNELLDEQGNEIEAKGIAFCKSLFGGRWVQTSINAKIRKNYAGVGYVYDVSRNAFIPPKPFPSWSLNEETCRWVPPVPMPEGETPHYWDEEKQVWVEVTQ